MKEDCDHDWKLVDDSFDHEHGTEQIFYMQCQKCDETKPYEGPSGPEDNE